MFLGGVGSLWPWVPPSHRDTATVAGCRRRSASASIRRCWPGLASQKSTVSPVPCAGAPGSVRRAYSGCSSWSLGRPSAHGPAQRPCVTVTVGNCLGKQPKAGHSCSGDPGLGGTCRRSAFVPLRAASLWVAVHDQHIAVASRPSITDLKPREQGADGIPGCSRTPKSTSDAP